MRAPYRLVERISARNRTSYEIRDQGDRCVSRPRGYAKALREVEFLNKQAVEAEQGEVRS